MKLTINKYGLQGTPTEVTMYHLNNEITWNIALFDKTSSVDKDGISDAYDIFEFINVYWSYISVAEQNKIFDCYCRIRTVFDNVWDTTELTRQLHVLIAELCSYHDLDQIKQWIIFHANIIIPDNFSDVYSEKYETTMTREKTYLRRDYEGLLALSVGLRIMVPVWGEFVYRTKKETGNNLKEYYAFKLLELSNFKNSEPMERLKIYVECSIPQDKSRAGAIINAIASEDYSTWMLALIAVRRLSVGDVRGIIAGSSLITYIYKFINGKIKGHDNSFNGKITDKIIEGQSADSENNLSKLEGYKIKQEIPAGDIAIIESYIKRYNIVAQKVCQDVDLELVRMCVEHIENDLKHELYAPQITLAQWILKPAIPPRGLLHVNKRQCITAVGIAQALLWHKKHYDLAGLIGAAVYENIDELAVIGGDSRARITRSQLEVLNEFCPYIRKPFGKQRKQSASNPAQESIDLLNEQFNRNWRLQLPPALASQIPNGQGQYIIPYDIKVKIAELATALVSRSFYRGDTDVSATEFNVR